MSLSSLEILVLSMDLTKPGAHFSPVDDHPYIVFLCLTGDWAIFLAFASGLPPKHTQSTTDSHSSIFMGV